MRKFWKKKESGVVTMHPVWQKLSAAVNAKAKRLAGCLNAEAAKLGRRNTIVILVVFCIGWSAVSVGIAVHALRHPVAKIQVTAISVPPAFRSQPLRQADTAAQQALKRIHVFKQFLDSLRLADTAGYRKLKIARPGLIDSIDYIEQYYSGGTVVK
jgi:hypothetical protein